MRIISTRTHARLDYMYGILLINAPWIFRFNDGTVAEWLPVLMGVAMIFLSLFTHYEGGVFRAISFKTHLLLDITGGLILMAAPWLFRFSHEVFLPHLVLGVFPVVVSLVTKTVPYNRRIAYSVW
ncbi:hypothetical protein AAHN97_04225 [Chitinophaga niabensis]|uniref:SPW repeat domain-containing protein n=1 Tax=Chitinophaga niabensis TaxID=536979 RepID=UPI0031BBB792